MGIKKILKKAGKAAAIGAALYGATKLGRRRATNKPGNDFAKARKAMTSDAAYGNAPYVDAIRRQKTITPPVNKRKEWRHGRRDGTSPFLSTPNKTLEETLFDRDDVRGRPYSFKKGGRVTGCAKRGFGRALKRK